MPIRKTVTRVLVVYTMIILAVTAASKVYLIFLGGPITGPDPFLRFLPSRAVMAITMLLECGVMILLLSRISETIKILGIAWISSLFVLYRAGLFAVGHVGQCPCLALPATWQDHLERTAHLDSALKLCLALMWVPSVALCAANYAQWRVQSRKT